MNPIDITPEDLATVRSILMQFVPGYEVWAFGSRVTGKARRYSDLDLAIITQQPLAFDTYAALKAAFSESSLPFKVDIVDWMAADESFQKLIQQQHVIIK